MQFEIMYGYRPYFIEVKSYGGNHRFNVYELTKNKFLWFEWIKKKHVFENEIKMPLSVTQGKLSYHDISLESEEFIQTCIKETMQKYESKLDREYQAKQNIKNIENSLKYKELS